jgi:DICT domain-containing protein/signal transduction histidine kinase
MSIQTSVLDELLKRAASQIPQGSPQLRPQLYFKSSLTALSHAMEDQVLAGGSEQSPLVIASFQQERFYRQEANRYRRIAELTNQVYVLAAPDTSFINQSREYETIAFDPDDQLSQEWHLVVIGQKYAACLVCQERQNIAPLPTAPELAAMDQTRRFEGIWTFDRQVSYHTADILLDRILVYRPELREKIEQAKQDFLCEVPRRIQEIDPDPFAQRLVTYIQASQYKLQKAYRSIASQERRERLINSITSSIRRSLDPNEIFKVAVEELGQVTHSCRCLIYPCKPTDASTTITYESLADESLPSLVGQTWSLADNPLFQVTAQRQESLAVTDTRAQGKGLVDFSTWGDPSGICGAARLDRWQIRSWLMVPILYQGRMLGMVEMQHCQPTPHTWSHDEITLIEAVAIQLGVALIQAESYANLEDLNQQLAALERTRSNLIAITGHELRTPLTTIQVCLESLASEPDMMPELRQVMLDTALTDADRMRKLIQDFLILSRLESGRVEWHLEPISLDECVSLALSSIHTRPAQQGLPHIRAQVPVELPPVQADGEWLVEVLSKLLDNACKFTEPEGEVLIEAKPNGGKMLEVTITDTGRGIEPNRLETVFERFYQEEGALRRTAGGTGIGLAICRQIIRNLGGTIWAESLGRDQGSQFHFTLPIATDREALPERYPPQTPNPKPQTKRSSRAKK